MRELEARYPCPVCLGVAMTKTPVGRDGSLILDHCDRCGGIWFDAGEVQRLRAKPADLLWKAIAQRDDTFRMQCHSCFAFMDRNVPRCEACGWKNVLECPVCSKPLQSASQQGVKLDACRSCKGVWFDHEELLAIWRVELGSSLRRHTPSSGVAETGALVVLDALTYSPWLALEGMHAAGHVLGASASALSHAPEAVTGVVEAAGDAASGVFATIVEIISGLFD